MEVIRVPRAQFIKRGRAKMLDRLKEDLNEILPDNDSVFMAYHRGLKWDKYKEEVMQFLLKYFTVLNTVVFLGVRSQVISSSDALTL